MQSDTIWKVEKGSEKSGKRVNQTKKRKHFCFLKSTGDEGIEPPLKVLETLVIPFDQSPRQRTKYTRRDRKCQVQKQKNCLG